MIPFDTGDPVRLDLEKRTRELATTCRSAGIRDSIQMNFGSVIAAREPGDDDGDDN